MSQQQAQPQISVDEAFNTVVAIIRGKAMMTGVEHELAQASLRCIASTIREQRDRIAMLESGEIEVDMVGATTEPPA